MVNKFLSVAKKIPSSLGTVRILILIQQSGLYNRDWYLKNNPDVRLAKIRPLLHYLFHGGFEGRDPGPGFSSRGYLESYPDVRRAGVNPLVHYLKSGRVEGRLAQPHPEPVLQPRPILECPVCKNRVEAFLPLSPYYLENIQRYGYPYTFEEAETLNSEGYTCPHCGANDRDRLYACYLEKKMSQYHARDPVLLLDIAPSVHLGHFLDTFDHVVRHTADLILKDVDLAADVTNMPEIASDSYEAFICSHVLEHVSDDGKALSELHRVLKPGGWGILMVPIITTIDEIDEDPEVTDEAERWRRFGQGDHVRLYSRRGFIARVEKAGFHLKQLGVEYFGEAAFRRYGITLKSILYVVEKSPLRATKSNQQEMADVFFIVGTRRSGTTLMAQVLNAHSRICVPPELQIVFETSNNGERLAEIFSSQKNLTFQADDYIRLVEGRCPHDLQQYYDYRAFFLQCHYPITSLQVLLTELYTDIARSQGKTMFAEQTPWYGQNIRLLHRLFPQAKFIHMLRDGRDVAISFARTPWWHKDVNLNLERWIREVKEIEDAGLFLPGGFLHTIRYEEFVSRPEEMVKSVCDLLGVTFEEAMLDVNHHMVYSQFAKGYDSKAINSIAYQNWQNEKKSAFFSDNVYGWKTNQEFHFEELSTPARQTLRRFGYED